MTPAAMRIGANVVSASSMLTQQAWFLMKLPGSGITKSVPLTGGAIVERRSAPMPDSYFTKPNRLHSMADVNQLLAQRTSGRSGEVQHPSGAPSVVPPASTAAAEMPKLIWNKPIQASQTTADGRYRISRSEVKGQMVYYAWSEQKPVPKLLGYPLTAAEARALCQTHSESTS